MSSPEGRIFSSWKEIAAFLGRGVRTVQRWEKTLGLPIGRPNGYGSNIVVANENDLREWSRQARTRSEKRQTDATGLREIAEKLDAVEQEHQRLYQLLIKIEARLEQFEDAQALGSRFDGDGRSGRDGKSPYRGSRTRHDGGGDSSSGAA